MIKSQAGITLIELVVGMVAFAIISTGAIAMFSGFTVNQAIQNEVAEGNRLASIFIEDIGRLNYESAAPATTRSEFTGVDDYHNLKNSGCDSNLGAPCSPNGQPLQGYAGFTVNATVSEAEVADKPAKQVMIEINTPAGGKVVVSTYKFRMGLI